jgi:formylglycine-generating enzyme required for sulfatase activity
LLIFIVLAIPIGLVLHKTSFGRFTYAIGNNQEACRFSGVNIKRILMIIFITSGLMAALAGIMMTGRYASVKGDIGLGAELDVITAVVLGGVDINGGSGSMIGVILALFLLGLVRYGMNLVNVPAQIQIIATGLLLIVSIILPQLVRQATAQKTMVPGTLGRADSGRRKFFWTVGAGAVVVLAIVLVVAAQCGGPAPGGGAGPGAPAQPGATQQAATPTESVVLSIPTSVQVPPTRTPRPAPTQAPAATSAPTPEATPTAAGTAEPAAVVTVGPTATNIVMAMLPSPAPAAAAGEADQVEIPAGQFTMGSEDGSGNETPVRLVDLPAFLMDKFEVTNAQFDQFTKATGYQTEIEKAGANKTWRSFFTPDRTDHPVVKVAFADAEAYCKWAGGRLPTETEWEKAARGTDKRAFPWGNLWDVAKANIKQTGVRGTVAVGSYPGGASPYGAEDMAGNVGEWTSSPFVAYPGSTFNDAQYRPEARVTRGGGWFDDQKQIRTSARNGAVQSTANDDLGFRCASDKK